MRYFLFGLIFFSIINFLFFKDVVDLSLPTLLKNIHAAHKELAWAEKRASKELLKSRESWVCLIKFYGTGQKF